MNSYKKILNKLDFILSSISAAIFYNICSNYCRNLLPWSTRLFSFMDCRILQNSCWMDVIAGSSSGISS